MEETMNKKRILLVDDEPLLRESLSRDLEQEGYQVTVASDGEEAISKINKSGFDLVITDLVMPVVGGLEVVRAAKEKDVQTGIVILTAYGHFSSAVDALRLDADDYLAKPYEPEELFFRIKKCLDKRDALKKLKLYEDILPICSYCKSIRDDSGTELGKGKWVSLEEYIQQKSGTNLSHGCCPKCLERLLKEQT